MVLTHQLFCVKDLSSNGKSTRRANSGIPRAHLGSDGLSFFCHSRSDLEKVGRHHHHAHTPHLALPLVSLPLFFSHPMSPLLYRLRTNANSTIVCPCVLGRKTTMRNHFGAAGSAREGSLHLSQGGGACRCTSFDHQLLTGEADSDEVQLLTVGGETEDDLFLPTFVKVGEFWLNDARGPQRCRRRGPGLRHASRGIDVFFSKENEKFSADAPQVQEDGVEAVQSPPPLPPRSEASMLRSREWMHACRGEARRATSTTSHIARRMFVLSMDGRFCLFVSPSPSRKKKTQRPS